jgi:hypothetical protein
MTPMNVRIKLKPDDLDTLCLRFEMARLEKPLFINSVPKSGTHLLVNIMRMFVAPGQQHKGDYVQHGILHMNARVFASDDPLLGRGHLFFSDMAAIMLRNVNHLVLVRDPYDWVVARTRFFLSDEFQGNLNNIKNGAASIEDVMNMMIFGVIDKAPSLGDIYNHNAAAWLGTKAHIVRYEDIVAHLKVLDTPAAETFFRDLVVTKAGITKWPSDWRERVEMGADRQHSATSREKLSHTVEAPDMLPDAQKRLVDYHAPGLRRLLGYE